MGAGVAVEFVKAEVIATSSSARSPSSGAYAFVLDVRTTAADHLQLRLRYRHALASHPRAVAISLPS